MGLQALQAARDISTLLRCFVYTNVKSISRRAFLAALDISTKADRDIFTARQSGCAGYRSKPSWQRRLFHQKALGHLAACPAGSSGTSSKAAQEHIHSTPTI